MHRLRWKPWRIIPAPSPAAPITLKNTLAEVAFVLVVTFAYFLTRGLITGRTGDAVAHADDILAVERIVHLDPEAALQALALQYPWLVQAANVFYLVGHVPVLLTVAVWLYARHPWAYHWFRNAFLLSALLGLTVYVVLPVAPPRFLPGFVDTLKASGVNLDGSSIGLLYNPYAAMPSLHVGWELLAGVAIVAAARVWWLKAAGLALPFLMTFTVLITGNHYLLDVVVGTMIALISLSFSAWWSVRSQLRMDLGAPLSATRLDSDEIHHIVQKDVDQKDQEGEPALAKTLAAGMLPGSQESTYVTR